MPPRPEPAEPAAGFWPRWLAWSLDASAVAPLAALLAWWPLRPAVHGIDAALLRLRGTLDAALDRLLMAGDALPTPQALLSALARDPAVQAAALDLNSALLHALALALGAWLAVAAAWWIGFEAARGATPGKRLVGIAVRTRTGARPGLRTAALRFAAGGLSWLSLNLGHAMAALAPAHRALHDRIAGTSVVHVDADAQRMPRWGWPLIGMQASAAMLALAWLALRWLQAVAA
ncbi:RDD family protein [Coralloluteibacterium thermophilus]|uniref:RDD family protein n=1 Tax=Coralloluteibacterium thermophilum TaxID=2707049 RepID=A0ABV9NM84_9GAMM